ncbi:glycosyltransferase family 2 protein [Flavobacteriaceae bacterium]|nr:glycosyltransferase family 2 protein [Flavobacteriaceae bacterium]MDB9988481.1 glycosyltransferase family 2 protein [Flavobacteriaceae bacterium]
MENIWLYLSLLLMLLYSVSLILVLFYSLSQLNLLWNYIQFQKKKEKPTVLDISNPEKVPYVTIQLPVFNELYVMERLLECINLIDYPRTKLEIQVLDDSTDESVELTRTLVADLQKGGLDITQIRRKDRVGFKAGALKEGLITAKGEFIAIFDADFLPQSDWLLQTVPQFENEEIGVVQTRWSHINRDYSVLTQIQAFALDAHFTLEQVGRNSKDHFMNFNGTAGIWRKTCIIDAGNWEGDTLTEDLDLSYRAQLKNWKFKYLEDVETPSELPVVMSSIRSQQFRWNKGGAENFQKMVKKVVRSKNIKLSTKLHSVLHLLNSTMFLNVFFVGVLSIPMLYIKNEWGHLSLYFDLSSFFIVSTLIFFSCYWVLYKYKKGGGLHNFLDYIKLFFTFYTVAMGFSYHNSLAVLEGHRGKRSDFIRTPKFNIKTLKDSWEKKKYTSKKISKNTLVEGLLTLYFLFGMYSAFVVGEAGDFGLFPFHLMLFIGFGFVFINSFKTQG